MQSEDPLQTSADSNNGSPESGAPPTNRATSSGGVKLKGHKIKIGADVVGRDKRVTIHIDTVNVGAQRRVKPWLFVEKRRWAILLGVLLMVVIVIVFLLVSQVSPCDKVVPIIQTFTVQYPEGTSKSFQPGDVVEVTDHEQVLIEAKIPGQSTARCNWSAGKGFLTSASGCSTWYRPSLDGTNDFLTVQAQTSCNAAQSFSSVHLRIVQSQSQP